MFKTKYNLKQSDIDNAGQVSQVEFEEKTSKFRITRLGFLFVSTHSCFNVA